MLLGHKEEEVVDGYVAAVVDMLVTVVTVRFDELPGAADLNKNEVLC